MVYSHISQLAFGMSSKGKHIVGIGALLVLFVPTFIPEHDSCSKSLFRRLISQLPPLVPSLKLVFKHLYTRIHRKWTTYDTYDCPSEEAKYWKSSLSGQAELHHSDARHTGFRQQKLPPVVMSYSPALPPLYREGPKQHRENIDEYYISPRVFCKWHRMVFPGPKHPSLRQASKLREKYSPRDRREMCLIARMVSDEVVFGRHDRGKTRKWTPQFHDIWCRWLQTKGPDLIVVFE